MNLQDQLNKYFEEKKEDELDEMNSTANVPGDIKTPYAFGDGSSRSKKKRKKSATGSTGNKIVKKTSKHTKDESSFKKMMKQTLGLNESSYREFKKDPTSTPSQKVNRGIMQVNKMLGNMEKIVNNNLRLKTEMGVQSGHFWKATGTRFAKINERITRIANRLKELSQ